MSGRVDLQEFLPAYLAEVEEQLSIANGRLLEIESSSKNGDANPRAVRDLFRAIHTVKGLSAMVGVEPAVAVSHAMESVLRLFDRAATSIPVASVDVLLRSVRAIERQAQDLGQGKAPSPVAPNLLDALANLQPSAVPAAPVAAPLRLDPTIAAKLAPFEREALAGAGATGRRAVRVDFSPSPAKAERGFSVNTVRERMGSIAEIVKVVPISVPVTEDAPGALAFVLLLVTSATDEELAATAGTTPSAVATISGGPIAALPAAPSPLPFEPWAEGGDADEEDAVGRPHKRSIVRVDVGRLDSAMEHLSALIVTRSRFSRAIVDLVARGVNTRDLEEIMRENARQLKELRASILRVRMIPMVEVLERIPLILRGLRRESGTQVRLVVEGGSAELDKGVAERLFPAIVHLVRNAVDHAVEPADARRRAGKPEEATLRISCISRSNTRLELTVSDDGRGVDSEAVARRLGRDTAATLTTPEALLDALCQTGLSTKDEATTTSGRGLGMDIVRRIVVEQLGGELSMATTPGAGTSFSLKVPLTISIVDAFTMDCRGQRFVVPVSMVEEIVEVDRSKVRFGPSRDGNAPGRPGLIERRGETVPLIDLAAALKMRLDGEPARQALVVRRGAGVIAFALDKVVGQAEAVVRPLIDPLVQVIGITGATDLGDGKPTLVLDLVALGVRLGRDAARSAA